MLRIYSPIGLLLRVGIILLCITANGARSHAAESSNPVLTSTSPYPYELTTGAMCDTADDLKTLLNALEAGTQPAPDLQCLLLPDGFDVKAMATPVEEYHNGDINGVITRYDAPDMPVGYGIMATKPAPASAIPAPSSDDQHV